jgi:ABC-type polysaccharide/polyol phosphate export permease
MTSPITTEPTPERKLSGQRSVHEPHRVGLPPLIPYVRQLWQRRVFAVDLAPTTLRAQHFNTAFGQFWLLLNPVLLAGVYFILVDILRHGRHAPHSFAHLMACLFAFQFVQDSVRQGAKSVVRGGKLILNTAFPRVLLPISSVLTSFMRFLPTLAIFAIVHTVSRLPVNVNLLWTLPLIALIALQAIGIATLVAAGQVYFRDLSSFLPYLLRVWMYVSPVLYYAREVPESYRFMLTVNPMAPLLTAWSDVLILGRAPAAGDVALGAAWAAGLVLVGALFFMSREREFAVRL